MSRPFAEIERQIDDTLTMFADMAEGFSEPEEYADFEKHFTAVLAELGEEEAQKIDAYGHVITKLDAEESRLETIIKNLTARKKACANKQQQMKDHLAFNMNWTGRKKIAGNMFTAAMRESQSVFITNETDIPDKYLRIKKEPDKTAIKAAIIAFEEVPGAELRSKQSVSIK